MSDLYARRNAIFEPTISGGVCINDPNQGCILDLRLHWGTRNSVTTLPPGTLNLLDGSGGVSIITEFSWSSGSSGKSCSLGLAAKHPLLDDVYYSTFITRNDNEITYSPYIVQENAIYTYAANGEAYCTVVSKITGRDIQSPLVWSGGYILMDLGISTNQGLAPGVRIEPFNVIFDPVSIEGDTTPSFVWSSRTSTGVWSSGALMMSGNSFTNTPIAPDGGRIIPGCNFRLNEDVLRLEYNQQPANSSSTGIISINGVGAVNGNINITIL